ncbi:hydroxycinnamoyl-CoA:piscidic acid hydroxycinnamoyltransferase-like [Corylus avellana]|uniref:hydroxycinnamoyl-CoA:piscidic acid hydroxycinnamoyltransferase-like n=1 Tax=Corylus avellana TaxID=13451 RepID=UPI00286B702A|nr:hydroxycinnamoyl-CoA:piscidic acid hydroxycinnamoyltransferase-like [Corylus avellana]XP_059463238.1 hydroxycinnamoyl-CoA:piscidic acid hydroxycinnamoyltransferase-like [Corylus avellana]XP_059463240.1 hydroxycinnamoyl-CoA:piscidic acid hydroxycinnamoyltransferase-like [Corylus avellana]
MITFKSSCMIVPSEPTPNGLLLLSESDQVMQWTHTPLVIIYKPNNNTNIIPFSIETMKNSLSRALVPYYPLAGRLHWIEGGRLQLHCNAMGAQLTEAYSESKLDEFGDFTPNGMVQHLFPRVDYGTTSIEEQPLLLVQITKFPCGGLCVGTAISHIVADGRAAMNFTNAWAKLGRGEDLGCDEMPFHDRTMLRSREVLPVLPHFDHIAFSKPPLLIGCSDTKAEKEKETSAVLLKVTKEQVEELQKKANQNMVLARPYSRYEAIAGHMWRCACKARAGDDCQPTRVSFGADGRNRFKPPLPQGYFGNAIFTSVTSTCLYADLLSKPLSYAAGKLREAIERVTDEYITSALDFIMSQKDVSPLRKNFHIRGYTEAPFLGNPNINITSLINLPMYSVDFGWGKPVYVGPGILHSDGKIFIMSSPADEGSLVIALCLQTQYMDSFKKFFYEDI